MERLPSGTRAEPAGRIVAAVYSADSLRAAQALPPGAAPDWLELRLDHWTANLSTVAPLAALLARPPRPLLVTARRPAEGGADPALAAAPARARLLARFLPGAAAVDIEVRSLRALAGTVARAKARGCLLVASFHDFTGTPPLAALRARAARAADAGADIFKVATRTERPGDLACLLNLLEKETRLPVAAMGMGRLGRASRLALAAAGSALNYGYIGTAAQVPGQWAAEELRERLGECER